MATIQRAYIALKGEYTRRLRRIEGQTRGLQRMVDDDSHCIDIVTQVSAITSVLQAVALGLSRWRATSRLVRKRSSPWRWPEGLANQAVESFGTVDVVVLNHGLQVGSPLTEMAYDDAKNVLHSNLLSAFLVMKHFAPLMPPTGGSLVCVSSRLGMVASPRKSCIPPPKAVSSCWPRARR
jgi:DNA-binding FrmR family transcriptional regulator